MSEIDILEMIGDYVCERFGITKEQAREKTRKREIVQPRMVWMSLVSEHTDMSLEQIGFEIGDKDHATVLHAKKTVSNLKETNISFRKTYKILDFKVLRLTGKLPNYRGIRIKAESIMDLVDAIKGDETELQLKEMNKELNRLISEL